MISLRHLRYGFRRRVVFIYGIQTVPIDPAVERSRRRVIPCDRSRRFRLYIRHNAAAAGREFVFPVRHGEAVEFQRRVARFFREVFQIVIALRRIEISRRRIGVHQFHFHVVDAVPLILAVPGVIGKISHRKLLRLGGESRIPAEQRCARRRASRAAKCEQCRNFFATVHSFHIFAPYCFSLKAELPFLTFSYPLRIPKRFFRTLYARFV